MLLDNSMSVLTNYQLLSGLSVEEDEGGNFLVGYQGVRFLGDRLNVTQMSGDVHVLSTELTLFLKWYNISAETERGDVSEIN
jgi:hypothetical protein